MLIIGFVLPALAVLALFLAGAIFTALYVLWALFGIWPFAVAAGFAGLYAVLLYRDVSPVWPDGTPNHR